MTFVVQYLKQIKRSDLSVACEIWKHETAGRFCWDRICCNIDNGNRNCWCAWGMFHLIPYIFVDLVRPTPSQRMNEKKSYFMRPWSPNHDLDQWRRIKWNLSLASICFAKSELRLLRWSQSKHLNTLSPVSVISLTIFDCTMAENKTSTRNSTPANHSPIHIIL